MLMLKHQRFFIMRVRYILWHRRKAPPQRKRAQAQKVVQALLTLIK